MDIGPSREDKEQLIPDWESSVPYDWEGMLDYIRSLKSTPL